MNIKINVAKLSDLKRVSYITKLAYKKPFINGGITTRAHIDENIEEDYKNKKVGILVASIDNKIVGSVKYKNINNNIYLFQLVSLKTYRRRGVGRKLVEGVENICRKTNTKKLILDCMVEKGLPAYYERLGFKILRVEEKNGKHISYMEKVICK